MKKVGIFGGSFNPIHNGHIEIALIAKKNFMLDNVIFVPSGCPPHKTEIPLANKLDRFNMTKLAIKPYPYFKVSNYELTKEGYSYSIDTIKHFKNTLPKDTDLYFIMGGDSLTELVLWKSVDEISKLCSIISINRFSNNQSGAMENAKEILHKKFGTNIFLINIPEIEVSSTAIRESLKLGKPVGNFIPKDVRKYIEETRIYLR